MTERTKRGRKRKVQTYMPGTEPVTFRVIDLAADAYIDARHSRMRLGQEEQDAAKNLLSLLHGHGLDTYEYDGKIISIEALEKVKVKKQKHPDPTQDE